MGGSCWACGRPQNGCWCAHCSAPEDVNDLPSYSPAWEQDPRNPKNGGATKLAADLRETQTRLAQLRASIGQALVSNHANADPGGW